MVRVVPLGWRPEETAPKPEQRQTGVDPPEFELKSNQVKPHTSTMAEPASRPQPKKTKPRAADDDEESQGPTEGTGMIAKNNKMEQVDSEIKETQGVLLKTMCVLDFSFLSLDLLLGVAGRNQFYLFQQVS